jgi:hypothetical protein
MSKKAEEQLPTSYHDTPKMHEAAMDSSSA